MGEVAGPGLAIGNFAIGQLKRVLRQHGGRWHGRIDWHCDTKFANGLVGRKPGTPVGEGDIVSEGQLFFAAIKAGAEGLGLWELKCMETNEGQIAYKVIAELCVKYRIEKAGAIANNPSAIVADTKMREIRNKPDVDPCEPSPPGIVYIVFERKTSWKKLWTKVPLKVKKLTGHALVPDSKAKGGVKKVGDVTFEEHPTP